MVSIAVRSTASMDRPWNFRCAPIKRGRTSGYGPVRFGNTCRARVVAAGACTDLQSVPPASPSSARATCAWRRGFLNRSSSWNVHGIAAAIASRPCAVESAATVVQRKPCRQKLVLRCEAEFDRLSSGDPDCGAPEFPVWLQIKLCRSG